MGGDAEFWKDRRYWPNSHKDWGGGLLEEEKYNKYFLLKWRICGSHKGNHSDQGSAIYVTQTIASNSKKVLF